MQFPLLACLIHAIPVVEAVGHVGGLLDLIEHDALADGVHHAGGNVQHVAGSHIHPLQQRLHRAAPGGSLPQLLGGGAGLHAEDQLRAGLGL